MARTFLDQSYDNNIEKVSKWPLVIPDKRSVRELILTIQELLGKCSIKSSALASFLRYEGRATRLFSNADADMLGYAEGVERSCWGGLEKKGERRRKREGEYYFPRINLNLGEWFWVEVSLSWYLLGATRLVERVSRVSGKIADADSGVMSMARLELGCELTWWIAT